MKIALFTDTFPPQVNGVANTVARYARALSKMGHDVCVFTISSRTSKELEEQCNSVFKVHTFPSLPALAYPGERMGIPYLGVLKAVREFNPDIIHTHTPFSVGWNAVYAARTLQIPLVGTHHTFFNHYLKHIYLDFNWSRKLTWTLTVKYYNHCDVVVSPTRSLKHGLVEHGLTKPIELLPNILDIDFYTPPVRQPTRHKTLVYMGRLSYEKNVDDVIRAMVHIVKRVPYALLFIIGDGPERPKLEALSAELGLADNCIFTGFLYGKELVHMLGTCDVYLTGSKSENMPLALMEAMAVGLPIVAVRSLGLEEMLVHRKNALLTAAGDPIEIGDRAIEILQNEDLRRRLSEASRAMSYAYSEDLVMKKTVDLYKSAIEYAAKSRATFSPEK